MFKRLFWLTVGVMLGLGASVWFMRFVRESVARLSPERVSRDLAGGLRRAGDEIAAALREGGETMRAREQELRHELREELARRTRR